MKKHCRLLSILLSLALLACALPVGAFANGMYPATGDIMTPAVEFTAPELMENEACCNSREAYFTPEQAVDVIRQHMVARDTTFNVHVYCGPEMSIEEIATMMQRLYNDAKEHTGNPKEGDYLAWHLSRMSGGIRYSISASGYYMELTYNVSYYTNAAQEAEVDAAVAEVVRDLDLANKFGYEKVRAIYDYITANVVYDYAGLNDSSNYIKYSAYGALIKKTSVCQGYASLFYRLALEAGVDVRVITGEAFNGEKTGGHAWNIVKLGDAYYNVDPTWDASYVQAGLNYRYYLKSDNSFHEHFRGDEYTTEDFYGCYPMSPIDFPSGVIAYGVCGDHMSWTLDTQYKLTICGSGEMYDPAVAEVAMWQEYAPRIKEVVLEGVGTISSGAFANCTAIEEIEIPASVTKIGEMAFAGCQKLTSIHFAGEAPEIRNAFEGVTATATYSCGESWSAEVRQNCGGQITWVAEGDDHVWEEATCVAPATCANCGMTSGTVSGHSMGDWVTEGNLVLRKCQTAGCDYVEYKSGARNATTGIVYGSVAEALNAAKEGDVISLVADSDETGKTLIIRPGVTLDLGNYTLKADFVIGLTDSMLNAGRYSNKKDAAYGKLVVDQDKLAMTGGVAVDNGKNDVIPVWNGVDAYVLANAHINDYDTGYGLVIDEENKKIDFAFTHVMGGSANTDFLKNGADDNALKIVIRLSWRNENGVAYQDFVYNADFVGTVAGGGYNYTFSLTGYDALNIDVNNLTVTAMILTDCGIMTAGSLWDIHGANG